MKKIYNLFDLSNNTWQNNSKSSFKFSKKSAFESNFKTSIKSIILLLMFSFAIDSFGQNISNYTFSTNTTGSMLLTSTGEDVDMGFGTTQILGPNNDDVNSGLFDIGFNFFFMGTAYTQFSASSNGRVALGSTIPGSSFGDNAGTVLTPHLTPFGFDIATIANINAGSKVHSKLIGTAPNRVLVVEWLNMKMAYNNFNFPATVSGDGTFQLLIYENNSSIEFKYAKMNIASADIRGPAIGMSAGSTSSQLVTVNYATNIATNATAYILNSGAVGNVPNLNSTIDGARRVYIFTPGIAAEDPIAITYTNVTQTAITTNWIDNSTTEGWFIVTRATNALFTENVFSTRVNSTTTAGTGTTYSLPQTGLLPGVTYHYKIQSGTEGFDLSAGATGQQITLPPTANNSIASGLWSNPATWSTGIVPTNLDNVTITASNTVTLNVTSTINSITVNGNLIYDGAAARTLTVTSDVIVNALSSFKSAASGAITNNALILGGSLINNGTIDFSNFANTTGATITFNSLASTIFNLGVGSITNLRNNNGVILSKGTSIASVLSFNPRGILTVEGANLLGFLTITNGLFQITGTNTFSSPLFSQANYIIPATGGFRLNNANATILGLNGSPTNNGLFNIIAGTFNIGTAANNSFGFGNNSTITISGGTINAVSRFGVSAPGNRIIYTQSNGTINVNTIENTSTNVASFDLGNSNTSVISITGGNVNLVLPTNTIFGPRDVRGANNLQNITLTGGTFRFGTATSGSSKTFFMTGIVPNILINNASGFHNLSCSGNAQVNGSITIPLGSTLNLNSFNFISNGATLTNNGTITGLLTSNLIFSNNNINQSFTGTGIVTPGLNALTIDKGNTSLTLNAALTGISLLRVNLQSGNIINSNKLTIGTGLTLNCAIQIGTPGNIFAGGNFDVAPNWNLGTGLFSISYSAETIARTTGLEIPPSRIISQFVVANPNGLSITGGPIDITNAMTLNNGIVNTTATNLLRMGGAANIFGTLSANAMINGPLTRSFPANRISGVINNATSIFPVGKNGVYLPIVIEAITSANGSVTFNSESFVTNDGSNGATASSLSINRYQALITNGASNFISGFVRIGDAAIVSTNKTLQAPTANGIYNPVANPVSYAINTLPVPALTTTTPILAENYTGYFAYGNTISCTVPTNQPTALLFPSKTTNSISLNFTAATSLPTGYLVVRYPANAIPASDPTDFVSYFPNNTISNGTVVASGPNLSVVSLGLSFNTTYDFRIFSFNNSGCDGPVYNILNPLTASVTTCDQNIFNPGIPSASSVTTNSFRASWTASVTPLASYVIDVATNNTFTNFVAGYQGLNVGTSLSTNITGLNIGTIYFFRVRAIVAGCSSGNSILQNVSTLCNPSSLPYSENFETAAVPNLPSCTININVTGAGGNWSTINSIQNGFTSRTLRFFPNFPNPASSWFFTNGMNLDAGRTYGISFRYGNAGISTESLRVATGTSPTIASMTAAPANTLVEYPAITGGTPLFGRAFITPTVSGIYYFGFNAYSAALQSAILLDDILVDTGCTGTPVAGTTISTSTIACPGSSITLSLQNATVGNSISNVWQRSPDGIAPYVAIPLATNPTLTLSSLTTGGFYRCVVACGANSVISTPIAITVPSPTTAPIASNQAICSGSTLANIAILGTNVKWYTALIGGTALNSTSTAVAGTFFASQTINGCESASRTAVTITIDSCTIQFANLESPGISTILNCQNQTFLSRVIKTGVTEAAGAGLGISSWFAVSTTNTNPATWPESAWQSATFSGQFVSEEEYQFTTNGLTAGTYYIASRFQYATNPASVGPFVYGGFNASGGSFWNGTTNVNARLTVNAVARPNALGVQTFCNSGTVANLTATGTAIKWYTSATLGTALVPTAVLSNGNYYASQTIGGCESASRLLVVVNINIPTPPVAVAQAVCSGNNFTTIVASGTGLKWYTTLTGGIAINPTLAVTAGTYFVSQTVALCESTRTSVVISLDPCSFPYVNLQFPGTSSIYSCQNQTFYARVYKAGVTEAAGAGVGITNWIGVSTTNTDPATWPATAWQLATFNVQAGNDDEFQYTTNGLATGTYYVASRTQYAISQLSSGGAFFYGGFSNGGGGIWNGTNNVNAVLSVLTVSPPTAQAQAFCNSGTVSNLVATGTAIKWYAAATGGIALASTTQLVNGINYFASQTLGTCESTVRTSVAVTINTPAAPSSVAQSVCNSGTVADLVAIGTGIKWYTASTGGTALLATTALISGNSYFASQTIGTCESLTRTSIVLTIVTPVAPTAVAQTFCNTGTVVNLTALGTGIKWYTTATSGTALASTTTLVTANYFASQTIGTCESLTRTLVAVTVNVTPAPTALAQSFCNSGTVGNLVANGSGIKWYSAATGGTALASTLALSTGNYYASQTIGTCESLSRTLVAVTINVPLAPTAVAQAFCNSGTVADLSVTTGTGIKWYTTATLGNALASTTTLVAGNYYASQTIGTCESISRTLVAVTINTPTAPTAVAQTFCNTGTVGNLTAVGSGIKWYTTATTGTALASTTALVSGDYFASQTIGTCESILRTLVAVTVNVPTAPTALAQSFCNSGTVGNLVANGSGIQWYSAASGGTALASITTLVAGNYFASQTIGTCESVSRTLVAVTLNGLPAPIAFAQSLCNSGIVADLTATGTGIKWYTTASLGTPLAATTTLVSGNYFASQSIGTCESVSRTLVVLTLNGLAAPTASAQAFCNSGTVANLTAIGTGIKWYTTASLGNPLAATATLVAGNYFASQSTANCESVSRTLVVVTLNAVASPTGATTQNFTFASSAPSKTIADLVATGTNVLWFSSIVNAQSNTNPLAANTVLVNNTTYYAVQTIGSCRSASPLAVLVTIVLGVNGFEFSGLELYPNPVTSKLTLSNSNPISSVEVFNLLGQKVSTLTPNALITQLDMSNLQAGTYLVQVISEGKMKVVKVIKN